MGVIFIGVIGVVGSNPAAPIGKQFANDNSHSHLRVAVVIRGKKYTRFVCVCSCLLAGFVE